MFVSPGYAPGLRSLYGSTRRTDDGDYASISQRSGDEHDHRNRAGDDNLFPDHYGRGEPNLPF